MSCRRQIALFPNELRREHGGEIRLGKRKLSRPISTKKLMHLTLRASIAVGELSMHTKSKSIAAVVKKLSDQFAVRIYNFSNNGNHLHFLVRAKSRNDFKRFLMVLSARITQLMTGSRKGFPLGKRFFDHIPYTRIVEWGRDFKNTAAYVLQNLLEAAGLIPYRPRKRKPRSPAPSLTPTP